MFTRNILWYQGILIRHQTRDGESKQDSDAKDNANADPMLLPIQNNTFPKELRT